MKKRPDHSPKFLAGAPLGALFVKSPPNPAKTFDNIDNLAANTGQTAARRPLHGLGLTGLLTLVHKYP
ncbi:hypothetical protein [Acidocella sp.]|uniref:hypothetical protein n=1 Tax=Acidocella sp. TaxID=50710 RepID=UPI0026045CAD|nr:hypothetical protein [Acidocella sp.]